MKTIFKFYKSSNGSVNDINTAVIQISKYVSKFVERIVQKTLMRYVHE